MKNDIAKELMTLCRKRVQPNISVESLTGTDTSEFIASPFFT